MHIIVFATKEEKEEFLKNCRKTCNGKEGECPFVHSEKCLGNATYISPDENSAKN